MYISVSICARTYIREHNLHLTYWALLLSTSVYQLVYIFINYLPLLEVNCRSLSFQNHHMHTYVEYICLKESRLSIICRNLTVTSASQSQDFTAKTKEDLSVAMDEDAISACLLRWTSLSDAQKQLVCVILKWFWMVELYEQRRSVKTY